MNGFEQMQQVMTRDLDVLLYLKSLFMMHKMFCGQLVATSEESNLSF